MMTGKKAHNLPFYTHVQRSIDAPLYAQIQRHIQISIATNNLKPGDSVPGEIELSEVYGVSRVTVRNALQELVAEGLLYRIQGKGTFVSQPVIQRAEPLVTSFFYEMIESSRKPFAEVTSEVCKPDAEIQRILKLDPDELVIVTRRLRYVDDEPIVYQVNITRESVCPGLLSEDLTNQSFQYTIEIKYGIPIIEVDESLTSVAPDEEMARLLNIPSGVPLLVDTRILYGVDGMIIGMSKAHFRGDRYTYKITRGLSIPGE